MGGSRTRRTGVKLVALIAAVSMVGPIHRTTVFAADPPLDCSTNGFCLSGNLTNLLGLPNGTLNIRSYHPWDQVVKKTAASAWGPLEAEARAALAAVHGVPTD